MVVLPEERLRTDVPSPGTALQYTAPFSKMQILLQLVSISRLRLPTPAPLAAAVDISSKTEYT